MTRRHFASVFCLIAATGAAPLAPAQTSAQTSTQAATQVSTTQAAQDEPVPGAAGLAISNAVKQNLRRYAEAYGRPSQQYPGKFDKGLRFQDYATALTEKQIFLESQATQGRLDEQYDALKGQFKDVAVDLVLAAMKNAKKLSDIAKKLPNDKLGNALRKALESKRVKNALETVSDVGEGISTAKDTVEDIEGQVEEFQGTIDDALETASVLQDEGVIAAAKLELERAVDGQIDAVFPGLDTDQPMNEVMVDGLLSFAGNVGGPKVAVVAQGLQVVADVAKKAVRIYEAGLHNDNHQRDLKALAKSLRLLEQRWVAFEDDPIHATLASDLGRLESNAEATLTAFAQIEQDAGLDDTESPQAYRRKLLELRARLTGIEALKDSVEHFRVNQFGSPLTAEHRFGRHDFIDAQAQALEKVAAYIEKLERARSKAEQTINSALRRSEQAQLAEIKRIEAQWQQDIEAGAPRPTGEQAGYRTTTLVASDAQGSLFNLNTKRPEAGEIALGLDPIARLNHPDSALSLSVSYRVQGELTPRSVTDHGVKYGEGSEKAIKPLYDNCVAKRGYELFGGTITRVPKKDEIDIVGPLRYSVADGQLRGVPEQTGAGTVTVRHPVWAEQAVADGRWNVQATWIERKTDDDGKPLPDARKSHSASCELQVRKPEEIEHRFRFRSWQFDEVVWRFGPRGEPVPDNALFHVGESINLSPEVWIKSGEQREQVKVPRSWIVFEKQSGRAGEVGREVYTASIRPALGDGELDGLETELGKLRYSVTTNAYRIGMSQLADTRLPNTPTTGLVLVNKPFNVRFSIEGVVRESDLELDWQVGPGLKLLSSSQAGRVFKARLVALRPGGFGVDATLRVRGLARNSLTTLDSRHVSVQAVHPRLSTFEVVTASGGQAPESLVLVTAKGSDAASPKNFVQRQTPVFSVKAVLEDRSKLSLADYAQRYGVQKGEIGKFAFQGAINHSDSAFVPSLGSDTFSARTNPVRGIMRVGWVPSIKGVVRNRDIDAILAPDYQFDGWDMTMRNELAEILETVDHESRQQALMARITGGSGAAKAVWAGNDGSAITQSFNASRMGQVAIAPRGPISNGGVARIALANGSNIEFQVRPMPRGKIAETLPQPRLELLKPDAVFRGEDTALLAKVSGVENTPHATELLVCEWHLTGAGGMTLVKGATTPVTFNATIRDFGCENAVRIPPTHRANTLPNVSVRLVQTGL